MITIKDLPSIWNQKHIEYIKYGSAVRNKMMAEYCEEQILAAKQAYYNTESPIMEDAVYDKLEEYLRILNPESHILQKVGATVND